MEEKTNAAVCAAEGEVERNMVPKKKGLALILCLLGGFFGVHKFYEGKIFMGILYFCSAGFFGLGVVIDLIQLLRKPSVYYVEKKNYIASAKNLLVNFRFDIIGYIVCGVAGILVATALGSQGGVNGGLLTVGLLMAAAGIAVTYLKTRDLKKTLIVSAIVIVGCLLGLYLILAVVGFVVIYIILKVMGLDLIELILHFTSKDEELENKDAVFSVHSMPAVITGPYGHSYHRTSIGANSADYASDNGDYVTIYDANIGITGRSASTKSGYFYW